MQIPPVEILPIIYEEDEELLCEEDEESLELQTSAVGEPEGVLTCSPDLSKSVKKQVNIFSNCLTF